MSSVLEEPHERVSSNTLRSNVHAMSRVVGKQQSIESVKQTQGLFSTTGSRNLRTCALALGRLTCDDEDEAASTGYHVHLSLLAPALKSVLPGRTPKADALGNTQLSEHEHTGPAAAISYTAQSRGALDDLMFYEPRQQVTGRSRTCCKLHDQAN